MLDVCAGVLKGVHVVSTCPQYYDTNTTKCWRAGVYVSIWALSRTMPCIFGNTGFPNCRVHKLIVGVSQWKCV